MKYFTKEWYNLGEKADLYLFLKASKQAETFSEDYYNKIYNKKLKEWLKIEKEISILSIDEPEFDLKVATKDFKQTHLNRVEELKKILPKEIIDLTKDIRVLALDVASKKVKKEIEKFCAKYDREIKRTIIAYEEYLDEETLDIQQDKIEIIKNMSFHDSFIIQIKKNKGNLTINLDNSNGFGQFNKIIFHGCDILKCECELEGSSWLYEEVYFKDNKIEVHVLLCNEEDEIFEFTISAKSISFRNKVKPIGDICDLDMDELKKYIYENKIDIGTDTQKIKIEDVVINEKLREALDLYFQNNYEIEEIKNTRIDAK